MARHQRPEWWPTLLAFIMVGGLVTLFSVLRVHSGQWRHADASLPVERRELHRFMFPILLIGSTTAALGCQQWVIALGMAAAASVVLQAKLALSWLKISHHMAFATLACVLQGPYLPGLAVGLALLALIGWSRVELGRHSATEVWAGFAAGLVASFLFWVGLHQALTATLIAPTAPLK